MCLTGCVVVKAAKAVVDEEHVNSKLIVLSAASVLAGTAVSMSTRMYIYCTLTNAIHEDANVYRYPTRHMCMDTIPGAMTLLEHQGLVTLVAGMDFRGLALCGGSGGAGEQKRKDK